MGNNHSKGQPGSPSRSSSTTNAPSTSQPQQQQASSSASRNRQRGSEYSFLASIRSQAHGQQDGSVPEQRRETKAEREARRLERERVARLKERERSMREEHVDGGFLVTMGIYSGTEDFNKAIVRQLQIERKLAPFWRSISEDPSDLTDAQLVAVARGQPLPPPDAPLPPDLQAPQPPGPSSPNQSTQNLTVPGGQGGPGGQPGQPMPNTPGTNAASPPASPTSMSAGAPHRPSRSKVLAGVLTQGLRSRNGSSSDLAPREFALPNDPFVNGQPLEVVLYRNATECPICFVSYPPYLNYTRCCGNPLCSECFVQIKRPDPHFPEHHGDAGNGENAAAAAAAEEAAQETHSQLVSEPAVCPYCTRPEFGVTYDCPPFRRGLVPATAALTSQPQLGSQLGTITANTAMSSQTSLQSATPPTSPTSPGDTRRRTQSLSANAPNVITTDRIRPDWATKLAQMRSNQARRAAAATALHHAAFLNPTDRQFSFARTSRLMRRGTGPLGSGAGQGDDSQSPSPGASHGPEPGPRTSSGQNLNETDRIEQFEEIMLAEAIRLSIASEEERRRKAEKEAKKEAKKKDKEERKEERKAAKNTPVYGDAQGASSRSSLSLGFGRRRGNSGASLRAEATVQGALASTAVPEGSSEEEGAVTGTATGTSSSSQTPRSAANLSSENLDPGDKGKGVDRGPSPSSTQSTQSSQSQPISMGSRGPSHLRQTSNISSLSSSPMDSPMGSYTDRLQVTDPRASGLSVGRGDDGEVPESMFNFTSMASTLGIDLDRPQERQGEMATSQGEDSETTQVDPGEPGRPSEPGETVEASVATLRPEASSEAAPEVRVVHEGAVDSSEAKHPVKEMGRESVVEQRQGEVA